MEISNEHEISGQQEHLLDEAIGTVAEYQYATQGQRFLNWLIDNIITRLGLSYVAGLAAGYIIGMISQDFLYDIVYGNNTMGLFLINYLIAAISYVFYYTFCEKLFKGYTLGKLITGTRAIRQDGGELTFKNALMRSLSRIVPFETFSGFNTLTWHDSWTNTMVVKIR